MASFVARWLGIDITTTEMALAASDGLHSEGFAATSMRGAMLWNGDPRYPAFDLVLVPGMLDELLDALAEQGWQFNEPGSLSVACRQHDMVVLDANGVPLVPALSWQCNAAVRETEELNALDGIVDRVGRLEERFILPKLLHLLNTAPSLRPRIRHVLTTGDWVSGMLAGSFRLSSSDALSNGLLEQQSRALASESLGLAGIEPAWFPEVIQSGYRVGQVELRGEPADGAWRAIRARLQGWQVVAGLGDNHASALGCGMRDQRTLVVSAGTSGTVNLACPAEARLEPIMEPAARFEFYRDWRLLLRMLPFCGDWYNRFLAEFAGNLSDAHRLLNQLALDADLRGLQRVECVRDGERYRAGWTQLTLARKVASVQSSIALELLCHVRRMLEEIGNAQRQLERVVLTGGLSQSKFFQQVFRSGTELLAPAKQVAVSGRTGPLRYKTSAYGALLNARLPEWNQDLKNMPRDCFPLGDCAAAEGRAARQLATWLEIELERTV